MTRHLGSLAVPALVGLGLAAGLLREVFLAYLFGASREIEVFRVAFGLPSILSEALAVSFVSVLIPVLLADPKTASLRRAVWAAGIVGVTVFLLGILTMPLQARILAPGITGADRATLVLSGYLCWGMFLLIIFSLPLRAYMSVERRLWPGASAPLLRSGGFVAVLTAFIVVGGPRIAPTAAWAALIAGLGVLLVHIAALGNARRAQIAQALRTLPTRTGISSLMSALMLVFGTQLLLSGGRIVDRAVASHLPEGTLAAIEYSYALLMATAAVIGTSANILLAPRIGHALRETGRLPERYWKLIAAVAATAAIAGFALAYLASPLVRLVFQRGAFGADDTSLTVRVLQLHGFALGPLVLALLLTQVLILTGGQRWLVPTAAIKLAIKLIAIWILLRAGSGLEGVAISLGIAEVGVVAALCFALMIRSRRNKGNRPDSGHR